MALSAMTVECERFIYLFIYNLKCPVCAAVDRKGVLFVVKLD